MKTLHTGWQESDSELFIRFGDIITPSRSEQTAMICSLIPADRDESFLAVEIGCGSGGLSAALLQGFPRCRVLALDGSPAMLASARETLAESGDRVSFEQFDLREQDWLERFAPASVRCFVSSLVIHHLDGAEKARLFAAIATRLEPGGALLTADLVEPVNERAWRAYGDAWDRIVRAQSDAALGTLEAHEQFTAREWNHFATPDLAFDKPSGLFEQLVWLREAGFGAVDCFWLRAGHAVYGGFMPPA